MVNKLGRPNWRPAPITSFQYLFNLSSWSLIAEEAELLKQKIGGFFKDAQMEANDKL